MEFDNYQIQGEAVPHVMPKFETFNVVCLLRVLTIHETKQCKAEGRQLQNEVGRPRIMK